MERAIKSTERNKITYKKRIDQYKKQGVYVKYYKKMGLFIRKG